MSIVPSPQTTLRLLTVPSESAEEIVRVIAVPVGAVVADSVKLTVGGLSLIVFVAVLLLVVEPELSVAFTYTVNVADLAFPVSAYAWLSDVTPPASVSIVPSPQTTLRLLTEPSVSAAAIVRVIVWPVLAVVADSVKLTVGGLSVTVFV